MACGSGCCGPPKPDNAAQETRQEPSQLPDQNDNGSDSGCGDESPKELANNPANEDADSVADSHDLSADPPISRPLDPETPACCEGKSSPCCDVSCLDRLALRACQDEKHPVEHESLQGPELEARRGSRQSCRGSENGKPCGHHSRVTRDAYAATLEALGCICRALLALGQESCCLPKQRSSIDRKSKGASRPASSTSVDFCCAVSGSCAPSPKAQALTGGGCSPVTAPDSCSKACCGEKKLRRIADSCSKGCCGELKPASVVESCSKGCCGDDKPPSTAVSCSKGCCGKVEKPLSVADSCADGCCAGDEPALGISSSNYIPTDASHSADLEKGFSGREHVILSISGMTCTGCETKLRRALAPLDSVKNLKTSLVLSRAEFDLDLAAGSLVDVMKQVERTTEFKCERITNRGSNIDIIADGDAANFVKQVWPDGVTDMKVVNNHTVQVSYDAKVVGARTLVEQGWGTSINLAPPRADPTLAAGNKHVRHLGYLTLLSILLTIPVLVLAWAPLPENKIAYSSASLALATIVQFVVAGPFYPKALKSLVFSRVVEMDLLIVLSTSAAFIFSLVSFGYLVAGRPLSTGTFFETSTLLVTLIMVGRYVATLARQKAVESISVQSLQTATATIVDKSTGIEREIDARLLQYGDVFKTAPDSRIPTDGTVLSGSSEVDESMITGESRPVAKQAKSAVIAGTVNGSGTLIVRLDRVPGDNTINTIAAMVDEAKLSKPKLQDLADRVAGYFVPVVVALTIITFVIWVAVGIAVQGQPAGEASIQAITYAITVLIVSCPCAIGLAVPMVVVIASGVAAEHGVIFKSAESIEVAQKASHVVFDKTGTLTTGKLSVTTEQYFGDRSAGDSAALLLGLVAGIQHPVSASVAAYLKAKNASAAVVSEAKVLVGKGIEATASGQVLRAGNSRWLNLSSDDRIQPLLSQGCTTFCFTIDGSLAAIFGLEDSIRPEALPTVTKLQELGIAVHLISGDDDGAVRAVAARLSIPDSNVRSRCAPADKQGYIRDIIDSPPPPTVSNLPFRKRSRVSPVVIFCGDGTNDAVALAQATVGIAVHTGGEGIGADVAKSASDVVLMRPSPSGVLVAIAVSKKSVGRIRFNFAWSFVYNLFAILLGAGAFVHARIPPQYAGLGELVSVLPVIVAAVLLRRSRELKELGAAFVSL
ncbi:E1-E2 ATPase-domain-containing protein [Podospora didyma]|uniref:E1-E2 ATPase-domain-containing protein n=1 Tax=Podospora didyma TaxID=330526 RepID=A0AAE0K2G0_9PEZI|nr:E1-E2 ATPase-domain-containing protein [Podospora didyma]